MVLILSPLETLSNLEAQETMGSIIQNCKTSIRSGLPHCKEEGKQNYLYVKAILNRL
jgi:DNA-directed RNA polymerase specialized sigma24 family protein